MFTARGGALSELKKNGAAIKRQLGYLQINNSLK